MNMTYVPILKAKAGELRALREMDPWVNPELQHVRPLIEVIAGEDLLVEDRDEKAFDVWLGKQIKNLAAAWPGERAEPLMLDTSYAERESTEPSVMMDLLRGLRGEGVLVIPVVHLSDSDEFVNEVRRTIKLTGREGGACIRLTTEDLDDAVAPLNVVADALTRQLGLQSEQIDLILDFGAISTEDSLSVTSRLARFILPLLATAPWRRLVVASGAFPVNLSAVTAFNFGEIPRFDRSLWIKLAAMHLNRQLDFGDYAVTHPALQVGAAFAAPPQLRYTAEASWLVIKGRRSDRRGHAQFYDLCRELINRYPGVVAPATASWGDNYIREAAAEVASGPGNAMTWRAIATSQHIAHVARSVSSGFVP